LHALTDVRTDKREQYPDAGKYYIEKQRHRSHGLALNEQIRGGKSDKDAGEYRLNECPSWRDQTYEKAPNEPDRNAHEHSVLSFEIEPGHHHREPKYDRTREHRLDDERNHQPRYVQALLLVSPRKIVFPRAL
jgi:hypothetical protein